MTGEREDLGYTKDEPRGVKSPCHGSACISADINARKGQEWLRVGWVAVCEKCWKPAYPPKLWRAAPSGYMDIWRDTLKKRTVGTGAYDVIETNGALTPAEDIG